MELSWSNSEISLSSFVKQYTLPQIVQIGEGVYGEDEETTLSRGDELKLHIMKEKQCFFGLTESGDETYIPLNSPNMVHVYYERSLTPEERSPAKLCSLFPKKYTHVSLKGSNDGDDASDRKQTLRALYFDKDMQGLVCLDIQGCEIVLDSYQLKKVTINDKSDEAMFIAEVNNRFKLPFTVKFLPSESNSCLPRDVIHLQEIVNKKFIVATSREMDCQSILTFPDTLDVTVFPLKDTTLANPECRKLCENLDVSLDVEEIGNSIEKDDKVYCNLVTKINPYASCPIAKPRPSGEKKSDNAEEEPRGHEYVDMNSGDFFFPPFPKLPRVAFKPRVALSDTTGGVNEEKKSGGNSGENYYEIPIVPRKTSTKTEDYTVHEVGLLLRDLNLSEYRETFKQEQVDGRMLKDLDKELLQSHFKMNEFHALKLKKAATENWRPSAHH